MSTPQHLANDAAPSARSPEAKVIAAAAGTTAGGVVAGAIDWALEAYVFHGPVPDRLEAFVFLVVTAGLTFTAGYCAPHTARPAKES